MHFKREQNILPTVTGFNFLPFKVSKVLEDFDVQEKHISLFEEKCPNVDVLQTAVTELDPNKKVSCNRCISGSN